MSVTASPLLFRNLSRSDEGRPPSLGPAPPESSMSSEEAPEEEQTERLLRGRNPEMAGPRADVGRRERSFGGRGRLAAAAAAEERASSMSSISSSVTISIGIAGGGGFERWSPPAPPINCLRFNRRAKRLSFQCLYTNGFENYDNDWPCPFTSEEFGAEFDWINIRTGMNTTRIQISVSHPNSKIKSQIQKLYHFYLSYCIGICKFKYGPID